MKRSLQITITFIGGAILLGGCSTMKMKIPDFDALKLPEFREEAENIGDYQNWASAPSNPSDLPSAEVWDASAKEIMKARDGFVVPVSGDAAKSNEEIASDIKVLSAKVEEYKLDDPQ